MEFNNRSNFEWVMNKHNYKTSHGFSGFEDQIELEWDRDDEYYFYINEHNELGLFGFLASLQFSRNEVSFFETYRGKVMVDYLEYLDNKLRIYIEGAGVYVIDLDKEESEYQKSRIIEVA